MRLLIARTAARFACLVFASAAATSYMSLPMCLLGMRWTLCTLAAHFGCSLLLVVCPSSIAGVRVGDGGGAQRGPMDEGRRRRSAVHAVVRRSRHSGQKGTGPARSPLAEQSWREQAEQGRLNRGRRRAPPSASAQRVSWTYLTIKPLMVISVPQLPGIVHASGPMHCERRSVSLRFVLQSMHVDTSTAFTRNFTREL